MKTENYTDQIAAKNTVDETPRIYVACLASYNAGILHGRWIDCDQGEDYIEEETAAMLKESTQQFAEEWAIHDHQFMGPITESTDFATCAEIGYAVSTASDSAAFLVWLDYQNIQDIGAVTGDHLIMDFDEQYHGLHDSPKDFAYDLYIDQYHENELGPLANHIDWESVWNDLRCGGKFYSVHSSRHGGHYIFSHS